MAESPRSPRFETGSLAGVRPRATKPLSRTVERDPRAFLALRLGRVSELFRSRIAHAGLVFRPREGWD